MTRLIFVVFLGFCAFVNCAHLPSDFLKCKRSDPTFNECLAKATEDGIKKFAAGNKALGLIPLEPLFIEEMNTPGNGGNVNVDQNYKNIKLNGLTTSTVKSFIIDFDKCTMEMETFSPIINILSDYELKGQMSVFPINGKGKSNQTITNLLLNHHIKCEIYKKKDEDYIKITDWKTEFHQEDIHFDFSNLLQGNEQLSQEVNKVLAESSNSIFEETKPAYEISYGILFKQLANTVLNKIPFNELFPQ